MLLLCSRKAAWSLHLAIRNPLLQCEQHAWIWWGAWSRTNKPNGKISNQASPQADRIPETKIAHGVTWVDNYSWMQGGTSSQAVLQHIQAEAQQYRQVMSTLGVTQLGQKLLQEMRQLQQTQHQNQGPPELLGQYVYFTPPDEDGSTGLKLTRRRLHANPSSPAMLLSAPDEEGPLATGAAEAGSSSSSGGSSSSAVEAGSHGCQQEPASASSAWSFTPTSSCSWAAAGEAQQPQLPAAAASQEQQQGHPNVAAVAGHGQLHGVSDLDVASAEGEACHVQTHGDSDLHAASAEGGQHVQPHGVSDLHAASAEGGQHVQLHGASLGPLELVLDPGMVREDVTVAARVTGIPLGSEVCCVRLSQDQRLLAYLVPQQQGVDRYCCIVRDIEAGTVLSKGILAGVSGMEFAAGSRWLLYTTPDETGRPCKVFLHDLLGPQADDHSSARSTNSSNNNNNNNNNSSSSNTKPLLEETSPEFFIQLSRTKDGSWLLININSKTSSEIHLLPAGAPEAGHLRCVQPRIPGLEYFVEHLRDRLYVLTNYQAVQEDLQDLHQSVEASDECENEIHGVQAEGSYCLMTVPVASPYWGCTAWQQVQLHTGSHSQGTACEMVDMDMFDGWLVLHTRHADGRPGLCAVELPVSRGQGITHKLNQADAGGQESICSSTTVDSIISSSSSSPRSTWPGSGGCNISSSSSSDSSSPGGWPGSRGMLEAVDLPSWALHITPGANQWFQSRVYRFSCSSPVHPPVEFEYEFQTAQLRMLVDDTATAAAAATGPEAALAAAAAAAEGYEPPVAAAGIAGCYECLRLQVPSDDGTLVPLTLISSSIRGQQGQQGPLPQPLLLHGYGAYGQVLDLSWDPNLQTLLDRGWRVAYAHVRGGGELGRSWHAAARKHRRYKAVQDYLACARFLVQEQYTGPGLLAGHATSAGCLLLGAALSQAPGLFAAAVMRVPFLDALTCMLDPDLPLTQHERDEWGDPKEDPAAFHALQTLCPYQGLIGMNMTAQLSLQQAGLAAAAGPAYPAGAAAQQLPPVLVSCSLDDARVPFWSALKWAAAAREHQERWRQAQQQSMTAAGAGAAAGVFVRIRRHGGHMGSPEQQGEELAEDYAFLLTVVKAPAAQST